MIEMIELQEVDFDGEGWFLKIGQVYSSPYQENHFKVTRLVQTDSDKDNIMVYYVEVDSKDYEKVIVNEEQGCRAWWVNEGNWDLERDVGR